jgi:hypothetical protein
MVVSRRFQWNPRIYILCQFSGAVVSRSHRRLFGAWMSQDHFIFARISRHAFGGIDLADTAYGATSEAAAFINALLHPVPGTRPEAAQALEHPWMKLEPIKRS